MQFIQEAGVESKNHNFRQPKIKKELYPQLHILVRKYANTYPSHFNISRDIALFCLKTTGFVHLPLSVFLHQMNRGIAICDEFIE